jgi:B-box zinc finger.
MKCARHPNVDTELSCTRCGTPICPDCMVAGAVGFLCRKCASLGQSPLYQVRPERFVLALVAGVGAGTLAGFILQFINFFIFFVAPIIGGLLGEVILRATGRKRGLKVEILTGVSVVAGAALSLAFTGFGVLYHPISLTFFLVAVALVTAAAIGKIRYL